jgi:hypothetical protein
VVTFSDDERATTPGVLVLVDVDVDVVVKGANV